MKRLDKDVDFNVLGVLEEARKVLDHCNKKLSRWKMVLLSSRISWIIRNKEDSEKLFEFTHKDVLEIFSRSFKDMKMDTTHNTVSKVIDFLARREH